MKVLFLCTKEFDYLQDLTFSGLCKTLGAENICVIRWNRHFFLPFKKYPKNLGYVKGQLFRSLYSRLFLKGFDAVIIASAKPDCFRIYNSIAPNLDRNIRTIFLDGGDRSEVGGDLDRLKHRHLFDRAVELRPFDIVLKREMTADTVYPGNVFPFPFCWNFDRLPPQLPARKKYDVSFWAVESHPIRTKALTLIRDKFDCEQNGTVTNQNFRNYKRKGTFYLQELASCTIVLNFRGAGWDTLRYWEAPALGSFLISQRPQIRIPDNFQHGRDIVFCDDDLGNLVELCGYYLTNDEQRRTIERSAYHHIRQYHTDVRRAQQLLQHLH